MSVLVLIYVCLGASAGPATVPTGDDVDTAEARRLFEGEQWGELAARLPMSTQYSGDLDFYRGMALAHLERWTEAEQALALGSRKSPLDARFPLELAGIFFVANDFRRAEASLLQVLTLNLSPEQITYANDFLGTIFYLDGNLDAALKYWNRLGKPSLRRIDVRGDPKLDPEILDRALSFSRFEVLTYESLRTSRATLASLGVFAGMRFELQPEGSEFDLNLLLAERNGLGASKLRALLSVVKGVPFETAYLDLYNLGHKAVNSGTLFRWDRNKRRVATTLEGPIGRNPRQRFGLNLDIRNENWDIARSELGEPDAATSFGLDTLRGGWRVEAQLGDRWKWQMEGGAAYRRYANLDFEATSPYLFAEGASVHYRVGAEHQLLSLPERRLDVRTLAHLTVGKLLNHEAPFYQQIRAEIQTRWLPSRRRASVTTSFRAGATSEAVPLDTLFMMGIERDTDLWLRAHPGAIAGKKGNAYMGRHFVILNADFEKAVLEQAWFSMGLGPFVDVGIVSDESMGLGSKGWVVNAGLQLKLRVTAGSALLFSYGRNLTDGNQMFYVSFAR